jgi:excisionase family DNA binding protein
MLACVIARKQTGEQLPSEDPYIALAQALASVIRQAVRDGVAEAVSEILPHLAPTVDLTTVVDVSEAANRLGLGSTLTKKLIASGQLPSVLIGHRRKVSLSAIEAYISRLEAEQLPGTGTVK